MQRMIDTATWDDPWFAELAPDAKLVFLYLLTNRRSTAAGAFEITVRHMAFETGLGADRIGEILAEIHPRVWWWPEHQVIWIRNFFRHQSANDKFTISAKRKIEQLPDEVQAVIATVYPHLVELKPETPQDTPDPPDDTHDIPTPKGMDTHPLVEGSSSEEGSKSVGEKEEEPAHARGGADAPTPEPDPSSEAKPKPRTEKQIESDRKYARSLALFEAHCRGIGVDPSSSEAQVDRSRAFRDLKPVVDKPAPTPEDFERCTRWMNLGWRSEPPTIPQVLGNFRGWVGKGKPDEPEQKGRASPNGRNQPDPLDDWRRRRGLLPSDDDAIDVKGIAR